MSEAAGGEHLPSPTVPLAYVRACDGDVAEWEERRRRTATGDGDDFPPYLGLTAFGQRDAERYFGRENLVAELVQRVRGQRVVGVFGPSAKSGLRRHVGAVWSVQFDASGTKVVSTSDDGSIRWWSAPNGGTGTAGRPAGSTCPRT